MPPKLWVHDSGSFVRLYRDNIGIMEKKMETAIILGLYRDSIGIMEKKMETTVVYRLGGPPTQ